MKLAYSFALLALFAAPSFALQGSDSCATPTPIAGIGSFAFDTATATTGIEAQLESICYAFGSSGVDNDVWFEWTSDIDGVAVVTTCLLTGDDTKIAAYPGGGCPPANTALACNDDACAYQSKIEFPVVNGSTYMLQVGNFPGSSGAAGNFEITPDLPLLNPTNGHYYDWVSPGVAIDWDTARLQAQASTYQGLSGHLASVTDVPEHLFIVQNLGQPGWLGLYQDHNDPNYSEPFGGFVWTTGEPVGFAPWGGGEPNNGGGNEDYVELTAAGSWNDADVTGANQVFGYYVEYEGAAPTTSFCSGEGTGTLCPCGNSGNAGEGCANGSGSGGLLSSSGSASLSAADLVLEGAQLISSQPGLYFQGNNAINGGLGVIFGDGLRCAGGGVIRLQVRFADSSGGSQTSIDLGAAGGVSAGDLKRYQIWYRDPAGSPCGALFNLTNGLEIAFSS